MASDPNTAAQVLSGAVGGLVGGGFALAGSWLTSNRTAHHETNRLERNELIGLAAEIIRLADAKWVADIDFVRAATSLGNAESSRSDTQGIVDELRRQTLDARTRYNAANDKMRSLVGEMRLRQPGIAAEAEALWGAAQVPERSGAGTESLNPSPAGLRAAETAFIEKVRGRLDELT